MGSRHCIALIRGSVTCCTPTLTIPGLSVSRRTLSMLFQNRSLELRCSTKSIKAIDFTKIWFGYWLNSINRAVLAARIGRIPPLVCCMTPIRCRSYSVVGLLVSVRRIDTLTICMAIEGRIRVVPRTEPSTRPIAVCVPVLIWGSRIAFYVAIWPAATVATSIVIASDLCRRTLLRLVTCEERMS